VDENLHFTAGFGGCVARGVLVYYSNRPKVGLKTRQLTDMEVLQMNLKKTFIHTAYTAVLVVLILAVPSVSPGENYYGGEGIGAITVPSKDVTVSFLMPGRIAAVNVKQGDMVTAGQSLVQTDDSAEQIRLVQAKAQSDDTTQIEATLAKLEQKRVDLRKLEWAAKRGSATELEVEHGRLDVKIAELTLKVAKFEHDQDKRKYAELKVVVERMNMKSPISGLVEKIHVEAGESIDGLDEVIRVVQTDPLWVDVPVPLTKALDLKMGQTGKVVFAGAGKNSVKGKVVFIAAVADAASGTLTVRLEVANKSNRKAGEQVRVVF
jgi:RND family efflux transporter MFP subunit